jgi:hypothetical protein
MLSGVVDCIASVAASFVVEGKGPWRTTDCGVGCTKIVVNTVIVDVAVAEIVGILVLSETIVVDAGLGMVALGLRDKPMGALVALGIAIGKVLGSTAVSG